MKLRIFLSGFMLTVLLSIQAQDSLSLLSLDLRDATFHEFVSEVEKQSDYIFFYRADWVDELSITLSVTGSEVDEVMKQVLRGSGLYFHIEEPVQIILLPVRPVSTDLGHLKKDARTESAEGKGDEYSVGGAYMEVSRPEQIIQTIVVGLEQHSSTRKVARVRGRITDAGSGEPVIGATMVITENGKGSVSDHHGNLEMSLLPGKYNAQFSFIGMETMEFQLQVLSDGDFSMEMQEAVIALNEVEIVGNHYRDINSTDVGVERLSMKSVKQMPLFMGENDVIKISRLLPGITSAGEASVGVNVRGGSADQNIFYINRVPVYNTSHMFGFFSAFNSDIIHDFSVYKGNVPVNYGGRLSSVFNILTRKGNKKNFTAHAGISPVSAHATIEAPIVKDRASFLLSGRTSYSDWMLNRMEDPFLRESSANFYDASGILSMTPNEKNDISLFYYQSHDRFRYGTLSDYEYGNRGGSAIWKHSYTPALSSVMSVSMASYSFANSNFEQAAQAYHHDYELNHNELSMEFSWVPALKHKLQFGASMVHYGLDRGEMRPLGEESLKVPVNLGREQGLEGGLFLSDNINFTRWLSLYAGIRYSFYSALGPENVMLYQEGLPKTESSIIDSLRFGKNELVNFQSAPEIRSALNIKTGRNTSIKLSFSQMRQYLFMLSNTTTISPTDQWKLSDYHLKAPSGTQYTAGLYHIFPSAGLSLTIEGYFKQAQNIVEFRGGEDFLGSPYTETLVLQGDQETYGAEFMLQRTSGRLDGWISYAWSRSMMQVEGDNVLESINYGDPYPSNYDRPHVLNVIGSYHVNRRMTLSSNLVYMSGRPVTYPGSLYYQGDHVYVDFSGRNQVRIPDYFRIDASITVEGNLKARKLFHSTWSLNVYNVLGRKNPQSIFFESEERYVWGYSFSVIGVPIVTLTWNMKLGNYESK